MANWTDIPDANIEPEKPVRSIDILALRDNPIAIAEGASGAPRIQSAALDEAVVTQAQIANAAVGQAQLKTATSTINGSGEFLINHLLPGGQYGFFPEVLSTSGVVSFALGSNVISPSFSGIVSASPDSSTSWQIRQRYMQASPPYEPYRPGDAVPLFIFALIEKASGAVRSSWIAEDPPWANNGPTVINPLGRVQRLLRARLPENPSDDDWLALLAWRDSDEGREAIRQMLAEPISQEEKNRDMALIPHPFLGVDESTHQVVVLNACDGKRCRALAARHALGDDLGEMLVGGYFEIDNEPMEGITAPRGVMVVSARLKATR